MFDRDYVAVKCGASRYKKDIIFNNLCIIHNNFEEKWWQDVLSFTTSRCLLSRFGVFWGSFW